jgi:uncharacterized membrane protein
MNNGIEILGTLSSVVIAVSLTQKNLHWLRVLNFIGALGFGLYGYLIASIPVLAVNAFIAVIDLYFYVQMMRRTQYFDQLEIASVTDRPYLAKFLEFYREDILRYNSGFEDEDLHGCSGLYILRDMMPVSVILFRKKGDEEMELVLDYAVPAYQDGKNGEYFFEKAFRLNRYENIRTVVSRSYSREHDRYLRKLGFRQSAETADFREFRM